MPALKNLSVEWVSLVDRAAVRNAENPDEPQRFLLTKGEVPVWKRDNSTPPTGGDMPTETMTPEETQAALQKAESDRDAALEAVTKTETERDELTKRVEELEKMGKGNKNGPNGPGSKGSEDEPDEDDLMKADLPPAVRARIEKAEAQAAEDRKRLEKAEQIAKEERDTRLTNEFIAKADSMKALPAKAAEFGPVLKSISDSVTPETYTALQTVLKAADAQIGEGILLKQQGSDGDARKSGAYEEALAKASELRKSDSALTQTAAVDRVLADDRELQARYLAEIR